MDTAVSALRRRRRLRTAIGHVDPDLPGIDQVLAFYKQQMFWLRNRIPRRRLQRWKRQLEARGVLDRWQTAQLGALKRVLAEGDPVFPEEKQ
jgi:hypothetical protein